MKESQNEDHLRRQKVKEVVARAKVEEVDEISMV